MSEMPELSNGAMILLDCVAILLAGAAVGWMLRDNSAARAVVVKREVDGPDVQ